MSCARSLLFMLLLMLCSCGDDAGDAAVENPSAAHSGNISVVVLDAATGLPARGARVQLLGRDGIFRIIDSKSGIVYENLPVGSNYTFRISAAGYASVICKENLYLDIFASGAGDVVVDDAVLEARLPKLGAKLQGSIAYMDLSANAVNSYAVGSGEAKVRLKLNMPQSECELLNPYREAATGLNGTYFFDSLPELASYELTALEVNIDGIAYEQFIVQTGGALGLSGDIAKAPIGIYEHAVSQGEFRLLSVQDTVAPDGKISLVFSKDINKSRTSADAFYIAGASYALETKWNGERILEISPVDGLWRVGNVIAVSNTANLYAADGTFLAPGSLATVTVTNGALSAVSKLWLENYGTGTALNARGDSLDLETFQSQWQGLAFWWNKAENATGYVIYAKCSGEINYTQIQSGLSFSSDTSAVWNYSSASYCFAQNRQSSFFVQARNARQQANSEIISIWGYVKPPGG